MGAVLAAEVDAQSFGCVGEAEATYGWGLLLLLLLFLLLLLGVVVVEGDHCAFGVVELLAGGLPKTLEGREEGVDCGGSCDAIRITARFRLRVHTLCFETATWNQSYSPTCDLCYADDIQGEQHVFFHCINPYVIYLRR